MPVHWHTHGTDARGHHSFDSLNGAEHLGGFLGLVTVEAQFVQPLLVGRRGPLNPLRVFLSLWFGGFFPGGSPASSWQRPRWSR